jgi:ribosomal protein S18 acetylase RimI-like enzyme
MQGTVIRAARVEDAAQIAVVHVRSWQSAYRGLLPQAYLDELDPAQRVGRWERYLTEVDGTTGTEVDGTTGTEVDGTTGGVLVAEDDRHLIGFISYSQSRDADADPKQVGEVGAIYLLSDAWRNGVGGRLMNAALGRLAEAGFTEATLWVLDSNVRARRFYEAGGWSADGALKSDESRGFPIMEVRYRKSLN